MAASSAEESDDVPDYDDFDLDRSTAEAWHNFGERLAEVVSVMDDTSDLTIGSVASDSETVPFVRFHSLTRDVVRAEAASNKGRRSRMGVMSVQRRSGDAGILASSGLPRSSDSGWRCR